MQKLHQMMEQIQDIPKRKGKPLKETQKKEKTNPPFPSNA